MMMSLVSSGRDPESCPGVWMVGRDWIQTLKPFFPPFPFTYVQFRPYCVSLPLLLESPWLDRQPGGPGHGQAIGHSVRCVLV